MTPQYHIIMFRSSLFRGTYYTYHSGPYLTSKDAAAICPAGGIVVKELPL